MQGRRRLSIIMLAAAMTGAAPLAAQATRTVHEHEAEATMAGYADCVVGKKSRRAAVQGFLRTVPETEASYRAGTKAADMSCLDAPANRTNSVITMRMNTGMLREALWPALYRRDFKETAPPIDPATTPRANLAAEFEGDLATLPAQYRVTRTLGDCMARTSPAASRGLLLTTPWTKADDAAVEQLKPAIAACLPNGQTVRFNRAALRAYVGEALYKLSAATAG